MADNFSPEQESSVKQLIEEYIEACNEQKKLSLGAVKFVITTPYDCERGFIWYSDFKSGVNWEEFFVRLINIITGTNEPIHITRVNSKIMHFTWHYGEYNNIYRLKCHARRTDDYLFWKFEKICDELDDTKSDAGTDDEGMDFDEKNYSPTTSTQFVSKRAILSSIESMHERLCKLGV